MGFTTYTTNKVSNLLFGNQIYTPSSTLQFALSTTTPNVDGSNFTEPAHVSYSRVSVNNNKTTWSTATNGALFNKISIDFNRATGSWGTPGYVGIHDGVSLLLFNEIGNPRAMNSGDRISFPPSSININYGLNADGLGPIVEATYPQGSSFLNSAHDNILNFASSVSISSIRDGYWSESTTWNIGRVPASGDIVGIGNPHTVIYDVNSNEKILSIGVNGKLEFDRTSNTKLMCRDILVYPSGELEIGTIANPIPTSIVSQIVFTDVPVTGAGEYSNGLLIRGKIRVCGGREVSPHIRLGREAVSGNSTVYLSTTPTGWLAGDLLAFPASATWFANSYARVDQYEERTITSIVSGTGINLSSPLNYDHIGWRNWERHLEILPHVMNLSRDCVVLTSENPSGTRGHVFFAETADVDVRNSELYELGRTTILGNQIGRYAIHAHHHMGPAVPVAEHQLYCRGNAIYNLIPNHNFRWGIAIHGSHYGGYVDNALYNWDGFGAGTEDGSESYNLIKRNSSFKIRGRGDREDGGNEGTGFWFRGPNNFVRDNVVSDVYSESGDSEAAFGFKYFQRYLGTINIPKYQGADTRIAGQYISIDGNTIPIPSGGFSNNECYACENGLAIWWLNSIDTAPQSGDYSTVKDFTVWHWSRYGHYGYPMNKVIFDGFQSLYDNSILFNVNDGGVGCWWGDYATQNQIFRNGRIEGCRTGLIDTYFGGHPSASSGVCDTKIENSYFRTVFNINVRTIGAPGSGPYGPGRSPKTLRIIDCEHAPATGISTGGQTPYDIVMSYTTHDGAANLVASDTVYVTNHNLIDGDNFQVFYYQQDANFIVPSSVGNLNGSPASGLTNQENWDLYGLAIAGAVAPTSTGARARIYGGVLEL